MSTTENTNPPDKKLPKNKSRLFTALIITLVAVGIGVIVYPFALIAIEEYNKNQVVAQLEREFPIFRADEDFELLDEAAIAAMPVVAVPRWTSEEVASANALLDGTSVELVPDLPIDLPFAPVTMPPMVSPTAAPIASVATAPQGDMDALELAQNMASLPDPAMEAGSNLFAQANPGNEQAPGASEYDAQGNPIALDPAQGGMDSQSSAQAAAGAPQSLVGLDTQQAGASAIASQAGPDSQPIAQAGANASQPLDGLDGQHITQAGIDASQSLTGLDTETGANTSQAQAGPGSQPIAQAGANASQPLDRLDGQPIAQAGIDAPQPLPGLGAQAIANAPQAQADPANQQVGLDTQSGVQAGGIQGQQPPSSTAEGTEGTLEGSNKSALPEATAASEATAAPEATAPSDAGPLPPAPTPQAVEGASDDPDDPFGPDIDPRTAFQLRDAPPVYYEDFVRILDEANGLASGLASFSPYTEERRYVDSPTELTVASINSQVRAVRTLLNIFQTLPSARGAIAPFPSIEDPDVIYNVALGDGMQYLAADLSALDQVVNQFARIKRFPRARDQIQHGFDHSVELVDHTLNILDYMAQQLDEKDTEAYLRSRSASMVGETEAVYLLELPALKLKIGCFPNVTFEQMYKGMRKGAALYPRVGTPNTNTNISMIAHRSGSAPFFEDLDKLKPGDTVLLHTRGLGSYRYLVERVFVVEEDDWTPMHTLGYPAITLVSCEEYRGVIYGRRIMVHCKLIGIAR